MKDTTLEQGVIPDELVETQTNDGDDDLYPKSLIKIKKPIAIKEPKIDEPLVDHELVRLIDNGELDHNLLANDIISLRQSIFQNNL
jgi:hypothetical protein